jgi:hypothetical protein
MASRFMTSNYILSGIVSSTYHSPFSIHITNVGFEVHTAAFMKSSIFWDITPRSPLKPKRNEIIGDWRNLQNDWINLAKDRDQWRVVVNTVMNLRIP